jgi:hypothetical protein
MPAELFAPGSVRVCSRSPCCVQGWPKLSALRQGPPCSLALVLSVALSTHCLRPQVVVASNATHTWRAYHYSYYKQEKPTVLTQGIGSLWLVENVRATYRVSQAQQGVPQSPYLGTLACGEKHH